VNPEQPPTDVPLWAWSAMSATVQTITALAVALIGWIAKANIKRIETLEMQMAKMPENYVPRREVTETLEEIRDQGGRIAEAARSAAFQQHNETLAVLREMRDEQRNFRAEVRAEVRADVAGLHRRIDEVRQ